MLELNQLYNMDCIEGMKQFPDKYFELAIVDVPYGIKAADYVGRNGTKRGNSLAKCKEYDAKEWDNYSPDIDYFKELFRISKNQIIWGANHFISKIPYNSSCWIVWDKQNGNNGYADCELAWTSFNTAVRKYEFMWHGMLQGDMKNKEQRIHPTQKPINLYKWLLKNYAKDNDKILDTHAGSASSLVACYDMGFDYIGFEIDKDYFNAAQERIQANMAQLRLWDNII